MVSEALYNFALAFGCGYFVGVAVTQYANNRREKNEQKKAFQILMDAADSAITSNTKEKH